MSRPEGPALVCSLPLAEDCEQALSCTSAPPKRRTIILKALIFIKSSQYFQTEASYSGSALNPAHLGTPPPTPRRPTECVTEKNSNNAAAPVQKNVIRVYPFWPWQVQPTKRAAHKTKSSSAVTLIKRTAWKCCGKDRATLVRGQLIKNCLDIKTKPLLFGLMAIRQTSE